MQKFGASSPQPIVTLVTVEGYDPNPLQTANRDLALDDQRRMVFMVVVFLGAALSLVTGFLLRRKLSVEGVKKS